MGGEGSHAAEVVEVAVSHEDGGGREAELTEGFDEHVRFVAGVDDETGLALHDDEAIGLQWAEREREDFERFSHLYLGWSGPARGHAARRASVVRVARAWSGPRESVSDGAREGRPRAGGRRTAFRPVRPQPPTTR